MHALYYFLTDKTEAANALSCVECRYNMYLDVNNWYQPAKIWSAGQLETYDQDGKKTGVEACALSDMLDEVLRAAAYELRLYGAARIRLDTKDTEADRRIAELGHVDLESEIKYMTPRTLSDAYADAVGSKDTNYERESIAFGYERALGSNIFPFGRHLDTPEVWRCYDLCHNELTTEADILGGGSIVVLDIHT